MQKVLKLPQEVKKIMLEAWKVLKLPQEVKTIMLDAWKVLKLPQEVKKNMLDAESTKAPTRSQKDHVRCRKY